MVVLSTILGADALDKISKTALLVGALAIGSILISGKGETLGESFSSGLTGIGSGAGNLIGNIGEGFGRFGAGVGGALSAIGSPFGAGVDKIAKIGSKFSNLSSAHQRNSPTTYNMRTIQLIREGRFQ